MPRWCQYPNDSSETRCCTTSHDIYIKNYNKEGEGLWPAECAKVIYPGLEMFTCMSCHPDQPKWTTFDEETGTKIVRVCKSLLREFYGNDDLSKPTNSKEFKQCGAWNDPDAEVEAVEGSPGTFEVDVKDPWIIWPAKEFANAEEFYNSGDFIQAKIPFMDGFSIMAVDDLDADGNPNVCYKSAISLTNMLPVVLAAVTLNFLA